MRSGYYRAPREIIGIFRSILRPSLRCTSSSPSREFLTLSIAREIAFAFFARTRGKETVGRLSALALLIGRENGGNASDWVTVREFLAKTERFPGNDARGRKAIAIIVLNFRTGTFRRVTHDDVLLCFIVSAG